MFSNETASNTTSSEIILSTENRIVPDISFDPKWHVTTPNRANHTDDAKIRRAGIIISAVVIAISMATIVLAAFYWLYFDKQEDDQQSMSSHRTLDRNDPNREIKNAAMKSLQQNKAPALPGTTTDREKSKSTSSSSSSSKKQPPKELPTKNSRLDGQTTTTINKARIESKDQKPEKSISASNLMRKSSMMMEPSNTQSQMPFSVLSVSSKNDD